MALRLNGLVTVALAAVAIVVVTITILFGVSLNAELVAVIEPVVEGVGGVGPSVIVDMAGSAWALMAIGVLSIPGAIVIWLLIGGGDDSGGQRRPESGASLARDPRRRQ